MTISVQQAGNGKVVVGGTLTQEQRDAIASKTPTAEDILNNMDDYNEEIGELPTTETPTTVQPKKHVRRRQRKSATTKTTKTKASKDLSTMDLEQEINNITDGLDTTTTTTEEPTTVDGDMRSQILDLLNKDPNAPTQQTIEAWKAKYGQNGVNVMALGEGDVYIFTHLTRGQWKKIQEATAKIQEAGNTDAEDALKEKVCQYCTLYPQLPLEFFYGSRAGVVDSLYQVIMFNSYFLAPQQAMMLTVSL